MGCGDKPTCMDCNSIFSGRGPLCRTIYLVKLGWLILELDNFNQFHPKWMDHGEIRLFNTSQYYIYSRPS